MHWILIYPLSTGEARVPVTHTTKFEVLRERVESLLVQKEFEKAVTLLEGWPSDEWGEENFSLLAPALHSMNGEVTWDRMVQMIREMRPG